MEQKTKAIWTGGSELKDIIGKWKKDITAIKKATLEQYRKALGDGCSIKDIGVIDGSLEELLAWMDEKVLYFYSKAKDICLGPDVSYLFSGWESLKNIEGLQHVLTCGTVDMEGMFYGCKRLKGLNPLSGWDVSKVKNMSGMFSFTDINTLDACSCWNIQNVTNISSMFAGCDALSDINGIKGWNVGSVQDMSFMFYGCKSLSDINAVLSWDTGNVTDMGYAFYGCPNIKGIGLHKLPAGHLGSITGLFDDGLSQGLRILSQIYHKKLYICQIA